MCAEFLGKEENSKGGTYWFLVSTMHYGESVYGIHKYGGETRVVDADGNEIKSGSYKAFLVRQSCKIPGEE